MKKELWKATENRGNIMNLPIEFEEKMQDLLGGEYNDYLDRKSVV